ncbi:Centromere_microtubule binding protein cbf5 [Enterospora canceri]|uniref:Centromere_microtubule binding protein cbf5 n=1 Tax=Enterospora canceri TaxID=1081671 RepID=A0A1Y1SA29_9MICR|nr:Centromere_microtubule binding protein cbf5 [Enterospora canceri]
MDELRRIKSGHVTEEECVTLHDLLDAQYVYKKTGDEKYLRKLIKPLESLLINYKRIVLKDSAVGSICAGSSLSVQGVWMYDETIDTNDDVVMMTSKGEAVAIGTPVVCGNDIQNMIKGFVCKPKRVIMEEGTYPKCWGIMVDYEIYSEENGELLEKKTVKNG